MKTLKKSFIVFAAIIISIILLCVTQAYAKNSIEPVSVSFDSHTSTLTIQGNQNGKNFLNESVNKFIDKKLSEIDVNKVDVKTIDIDNVDKLEKGSISGYDCTFLRINTKTPGKTTSVYPDAIVNNKAARLTISNPEWQDDGYCLSGNVIKTLQLNYDNKTCYNREFTTEVLANRVSVIDSVDSNDNADRLLLVLGLYNHDHDHETKAFGCYKNLDTGEVFWGPSKPW